MSQNNGVIGMKVFKKLKGYDRHSKYGVLFCLPGFLGFLGFLLIPLFFSLYNSLLDSGGSFALLRNIRSLLDSAAFLQAMKNTGLYLLIGGSLAVLLSFLLAWGLFSLVRVRPAAAGVIKVGWLLPLLIPTAVSVLFIELLFTQEGAVNAWLHTNVDWLTDAPYPFWIMVFLYVWKNFGYFVIVFLGALSGISGEQFETARLEGAGSLRILRSIVLPQIMPSLFFVIIMGIVGVFKMNRESYLLFGNYPGSTYTFQNFITNNLGNLEYSRAATASMLLFLFFSVMVAFMVRYSERGDS